jgi:hypothetical protein
MARLFQRTVTGFKQIATGIDEASRIIWDQSSDSEKLLIGLILLMSGLFIFVVPIVWAARYVAQDRHRDRSPLSPY